MRIRALILTFAFILAACGEAQSTTALLAFENAEGPLTVRLEQSDGTTSIQLTAKSLATATAAGIVPPAGQARIIVGNVAEVAAVVSIDGQELTVAAGEGADEPDGPSLDLEPGEYTVTISIAGQPDQEEPLTLGADEAWALLVSPDGAFSIQVY